MSKPASESATQPPAQPADNDDSPTTPPDTGDATDWKAAAAKAREDADKWKALSRKHEDQSKANAAKAKQFDDLEEAQKSELEKANERAAKAESRAAEIERRAMRAEIAAAKGVPADLLTGDTLESLEASADALLKFRGPQPKPDFGGGPRGADIGDRGKQLTRDDMKKMTPEQIVEARAKGQFDDLLKSSA